MSYCKLRLALIMLAQAGVITLTDCGYKLQAVVLPGAQKADLTATPLFQLLSGSV